jgi:hypothetical protein
METSIDNEQRKENPWNNMKERREEEKEKIHHICMTGRKSPSHIYMTEKEKFITMTNEEKRT